MNCNLDGFRVPGRVLGESEHFAPTTGANVLIVSARHFVLVAQLGLDLNQILNMRSRGEWLLAANARCRRFLPADVTIELDRQLRRPLKDVEELPERKPEQRGDDRDGMQEREELV